MINDRTMALAYHSTSARSSSTRLAGLVDEVPHRLPLRDVAPG